MRSVIRDTLSKHMNQAQLDVLLSLWNVDELGKINEWVSDDRRNLEARGIDPILLQLHVRVLIDKQNGVDNHMYGITTTFGMERILGRLLGYHANNCTDIPLKLHYTNTRNMLSSKCGKHVTSPDMGWQLLLSCGNSEHSKRISDLGKVMQTGKDGSLLMAQKTE